MISPPK
jgi:hypothetical protein